MKIVQLETGLFPDSDTTKAALVAMKDNGNAVTEVDLRPLGADDIEKWDGVVKDILAADFVVTI